MNNFTWSLESGVWKVEGDNIDCIFDCIIMFSFCYSIATNIVSYYMYFVLQWVGSM